MQYLCIRVLARVWPKMITKLYEVASADTGRTVDEEEAAFGHLVVTGRRLKVSEVSLCSVSFSFF